MGQKINNKLCIAFLLLIFTGFFINLPAQKKLQHKIDSLSKLYEQESSTEKKIYIQILISGDYMYLNPEKGLEIGEKALNEAKKHHYKKGIADAHNIIGGNYYKAGDYENSLKHYLLASEAIKGIPDHDGFLLGRSYVNVGTLYLEQGNQPKSLEYFQEALKKTKNNHIKSAAYTNIGRVYESLKDYEKALAHYQKAEELYQINDDKVLWANNLLNIGEVYTKLSNYKEAEKYYLKALELSQSIKNDYTTALIIGNIGKNNLEAKNYDQAQKNFQEALSISERIGSPILNNLNSANLGAFYLEKALIEKSGSKKNKMLTEAIRYLENSLQYFVEIDGLEYMQKYSKMLSDAYLEKGDHKKALETFKRYSELKDRVFNDEKNKEFTRKVAEFKFTQREDSIRLVNDKEIALRDASLQAKQKQQWLYIGSIFLLFVIGGLLLYQNSVRKKNSEKLTLLNDVLEEKNTELDHANRIKSRLFGILGHDLRVPVAKILHLFQLQKDYSDNISREEKRILKEEMLRSTKNLLYSMDGLLLWSKGQMENFTPEPKDFMVTTIFEDMKNEFDNTENICFYFENPENLSLYTDYDYLKTILRNLTSNSVKAIGNRKNGKIVWKAGSQNNKHFLSITDNGPGATEEQFRALYDDKKSVGIKTGLGLHLVRDMAKAIGYKVSVNSVIGEGTEITLMFE